MLTLGQVAKLYSAGVRVVQKRKQDPDGAKGSYDHSSLEIALFPSSDVRDRDITILHEFIHSRDGFSGRRYDSSEVE